MMNLEDCEKDILISRDYFFSMPVTTNTSFLKEIPFYTTIFHTKEYYNLVCINLILPLVGNKDGNGNFKINLYLDDKLVFNIVSKPRLFFDFQPLNIVGYCRKLLPGKHVFRIKASADKGTLYIPYGKFDRELRQVLTEDDMEECKGSLSICGFN